MAYGELVGEAAGALLFIRPDHIREPMGIPVRAAAIEGVEQAGEALQPQARGGADTDLETEWEPSMAPTQVKLVELVQFIVARRTAGSVFRISVVVSAWDLVEADDPGATPDRWLADNLPLLDQYLKANRELLPSAVFGVSAQGGELPGDAALLLGMPQPSCRIRVVGQGTTSHDVTRPLRWLLVLPCQVYGE